MENIQNTSPISNRVIIEIKPISYSVDKVEIFNISLTINKTAFVNGVIFGEKINFPFHFELSDEEYAAWGNDDNYILDLVLSKVGAEKA